MAQNGRNGNGNSTCPTCGGRRIIPNPNKSSWQGCPTCGGQGTVQNVIRVPWALPFNVTLTPGQLGVPVLVNQDTDADFEWIYTVGSSILANGNAGRFAVQPRDTATGRNLTQTFVNGENFVGTAQLPMTLPEPYIISRGSSFQLTFNELSNVSDENNTVQVVLHGYKLFPAQAPMQGSAGAIAPNNAA